MKTRHRNRRAREGLLTKGNGHLGDLIHGFSIPAFSTCPGATLACLSVCYALRFLFAVCNLQFHRDNWERALETGPFTRALVREIRFRGVRWLRIHVAGDFFAVAYIRAWIAVARACPRVEFLFYTRSWRRPELLPPLLELAALPNVYAWWSEDRDTGPADFPVGRRCYLAIDAADEANVPPDVDLAFRADTRTARKWIGPVWVCPKEQGTRARITCSACRRCLRPGPLPRRRIVIPVEPTHCDPTSGGDHVRPLPRPQAVGDPDLLHR